MNREHTFQTKDGFQLKASSTTPDNPKAAALILHGFGEHYGRYDHVCQNLNDIGLATFIYDQRGHGRSQGIRGGVMKWDEYLDDIDLALAKAYEVLGMEPTVLIAHSMGGLQAASYAVNRRHPFKVIVLSSPYLRPGQALPGAKIFMARILSYLAPKLLIPNPVDEKTLTKDPVLNQAYVDDPLVLGGGTSRLFTESSKAQYDCLANAAKLKAGSLLLMYGADDQLVSPGGSEDFFAACTVEDRKLVPYAGLRHEIFNELEKEQVLSDLCQWLVQRM